MTTLKIGVIGVRWFGEMHHSIIACVLGLKLEAMKMQNALSAERSGIVTAIKHEIGATLRVDDIILELGDL